MFSKGSFLFESASPALFLFQAVPVSFSVHTENTMALKCENLKTKRTSSFLRHVARRPSPSGHERKAKKMQQLNNGACCQYKSFVSGDTRPVRAYTFCMTLHPYCPSQRGDIAFKFKYIFQKTLST